MSHTQQDPQAALRQELMKQDKEQLVETILQADIQVREWLTQAQQAVKVREDALISRESDLDAEADQAVNAVIQHQRFALDPKSRFEVQRNSETFMKYYRKYRNQKTSFEAKRDRFNGQRDKCNRLLENYCQIEAKLAEGVIKMNARLAVLQEAHSTLLHQQEIDLMIMEAQEQERAIQEQMRALRAERRCSPPNQAPRIAPRMAPMPPQRLQTNLLIGPVVTIQQQQIQPRPAQTNLLMAPPSFHVQQPAPRLPLPAPNIQHAQDNNYDRYPRWYR